MKRILKQLLADGRLEEVARLAEERAGVLGALVPLTFDPDPLRAWRAVEAMGLAAARIATTSPAAVREHLRRLMWLMTEESGGLCWRAPEAMAEIIRRCPGGYADYIPIVVNLLAEMAEEDLAHFRAAVLWAIGRLGPLVGGEITGVLPQVTAALGHPDAQVRGMAVWALLECGLSDVVRASEVLALDDGSVELYEDGNLAHTTVAALAGRVCRSPGE